MAATLAQFIIEYPEFKNTDPLRVQPRLDFWASTFTVYEEAFNDRLTYTRTALELSETVFGLQMNVSDTGTQGPSKYEKAWAQLLLHVPARMTVSGGLGG